MLLCKLLSKRGLTCCFFVLFCRPRGQARADRPGRERWPGISQTRQPQDSGRRAAPASRHAVLAQQVSVPQRCCGARCFCHLVSLDPSRLLSGARSYVEEAILINPIPASAMLQKVLPPPCLRPSVRHCLPYITLFLTLLSAVRVHRGGGKGEAAGVPVRGDRGRAARQRPCAACLQVRKTFLR
jgi:hypothetical protein